MKKNILHFRVVAIFLLSILLLTACQPTETASTETPEPAQTEEAIPPTQSAEPIAITQEILLDPAKTEDPDSLLVAKYLYEGLVKLDENGQVQPGIARSWIISDDKLDYIFEIRPDAKFSDGSSITVNSIAENFNRWFDPQHPLHKDGNFPNWLNVFLAFNGERDAENRAISQVDGVQAVDLNTFMIHLNRPEPELLQYLAQPAFAILNPTVLENSNYGTKDSLIVSSGAYQVSSWTDAGLTLSPNPNYWNVSETGEINFVWK
ncbi:MAG TPA: ABC transporter substrate-binding protein [Anaerolineales bacterium]|nr:ABC transporter substrate-binding protein [Anaerolineales bacterium]HNB34746.1 ABC transporter substrate-binding protein [Anaerolineales bacterium]HNC07134.1 ABC transporter substrate-binding protein [Anaerolineales bacterium]